MVLSDEQIRIAVITSAMLGLKDFAAKIIRHGLESECLTETDVLRIKNSAIADFKSITTDGTSPDQEAYLFKNGYTLLKTFVEDAIYQATDQKTS